MTAALPATPPYRHVLAVPPTGSAVRIARETTELVLAECGVGPRHPSVGPALLILAELVTNAVRHAAAVTPVITVTYAHGPGVFAFAVHDRHPYQPPLFGALATAPGSGLATVVEMTMELGGTAVQCGDADGRGKSIRITLPL
ncbi:MULTISPECIES: ATP-binding protein [Streptomyces]|jgi:anti-sigma regulatory factor (Ser/Thr protein kinase)|uniref:ATP-binding protein n=1 Tax=Streptomyces TaxID=1883 RepID=UPI000F742BD2|nr:ATP-binding protein [Streptomyces sp. WAC05292]RSS95282.1 ATP-binding protein [Streptomyces sp. WAC05292]